MVPSYCSSNQHAFLLLFAESVASRTQVVLYIFSLLRTSVFSLFSFKSRLAFIVSFACPYIPRNINRFRRRFFVKCITSIALQTSRTSQYGSSTSSSTLGHGRFHHSELVGFHGPFQTRHGHPSPSRKHASRFGT